MRNNAAEPLQIQRRSYLFSFAHVVLGRVHSIMGEHESAIRFCDRAIDLNPSYAMAHFGRGHFLWMSGRPAEALVSNAEALRLSPRDPSMWAFMASRSIALTLLERYDEALDRAQRALQQPNTALFGHVAKMAALGQLGRIEEAGEALDRMHRFRPGAAIAFIEEAPPITDRECRERLEAGLRMAGMPK